MGWLWLLIIFIYVPVDIAPQVQYEILSLKSREAVLTRHINKCL